MSHWRPASDTDIAMLRAALLERARRYFGEHGVLSVDTPTLAPATITDPQIESIATADGSYLQTSPEHYMKRLLAAGYPDIYSICRVYRAAETGRRHLPEFTMIEWYRHDLRLGDIITDTVALIAAMLDRADLRDSESRFDYRQAFATHASLDPVIASVDELAAVAGADERMRESLGEHRDAWLDLLMSTSVARRFSTAGLTVVQHYPASQAALARLCPDDPLVADRFEVFYGDIELANGYVELTDAGEQSARMDHDLDLRARLGRRQVSKDEQLLAALDAGLPDCAGVALGLERLLMIATGSDDIRRVVTFTGES